MLQTKIREYEKKLIEQGIEKDMLETAECLLVMDVSVPDICRATDLPESMVLNLRKITILFPSTKRLLGLPFENVANS